MPHTTSTRDKAKTTRKIPGSKVKDPRTPPPDAVLRARRMTPTRPRRNINNPAIPEYLAATLNPLETIAKVAYRAEGTPRRVAARNKVHSQRRGTPRARGARSLNLRFRRNSVSSRSDGIRPPRRPRNGAPGRGQGRGKRTRASRG